MGRSLESADYTMHMWRLTVRNDSGGDLEEQEMHWHTHYSRSHRSGEGSGRC